MTLITSIAILESLRAMRQHFEFSKKVNQARYSQIHISTNKDKDETFEIKSIDSKVSPTDRK